MTSISGFLGYTLLQVLVICAMLVALCDIARRVFGLDELLSFCAAVLSLGTLGFLSFWLAFANYAVFGVAKVVVLSALLLRFGAVLYRRRIGQYRWVAEPLLYTSLYCIAVLALGFSDGDLHITSLNAHHRFSHRLPNDHLIPWYVADALRFATIPAPMLGDWLISDRPPLQTGLYLLLNLRNQLIAYQIVSAWLQATFLFGVWAIAVAAMLPAAVRRVMLLACCLLPTALINTFYVWPKLLSAGYLLFVFALLFCRGRASSRDHAAFGTLIGGMAALALLGHGSAMFALIGFAVAVLVLRAWPPPRALICAALALVALYLPWLLYQQFIEPPGNRLLKWHFAGVQAIDDRPFLTALRDAYGALSWPEFWQIRCRNLAKLFVRWPDDLLEPLIGPFTGKWTPTAVRSNDFFSLLASLHLFSIALIVAIALLVLPRCPQRGIALRMLVAILGTIAAFVLLMFEPGQTINHHGTYAVQILATAFAFMLLMLRVPWLALLFIAAQAVTVSATYGFSVNHDPAFWPLLATSVASALILAGYSLAPYLARSADPTVQPR
jgi:hypothetical protein